MKIENTQVYGFEGAIRGMRNARSSWERADSFFDENGKFVIGKKDLELAKKLIKMGNDHGKFARQIMISADLSLPRYIWQEFDTYKIGTVRNSCSTNSSDLKKRFFKLDMFETIGLTKGDLEVLQYLLDYLNFLAAQFDNNKTVATAVLARRIKKLLPESYVQKSTVTLNYQVARNMYKTRYKHWLEEWNTTPDSGIYSICKWISNLPYANDLIII